MAQLFFTSAAYEDLDEIVRYVGARDPAAAVRLTDRLEAECWGKADGVQIIRVIHGARDYGARDF